MNESLQYMGRDVHRETIAVVVADELDCGTSLNGLLKHQGRMVEPRPGRIQILSV
ncbi:MAG: hypothetical protein ACYCS1_11950 [Gammaproteobacteria bacterium]